MKKGTTNPLLKGLVLELKKTKRPAWKRIAEKLEKSRRRRKGVNLWKLNKYTKSGDVVVVPGKVLSTGELDHEITVAALDFSEVAREKISKAKAKCMSISGLLKKNPSGSGIKIME